MTTDIRRLVHGETTSMDIHDVVRELVESVGPTVVQTMAGVKDRGMPAKWAKADGPVPRLEAQVQLRLGLRVVRTIARSEGSNVALAWLMGSNPYLDDRMPLMLVVEGKSKEVLGAAEAFVDDVYAP